MSHRDISEVIRTFEIYPAEYYYYTSNCLIIRIFAYFFLGLTNLNIYNFNIKFVSYTDNNDGNFN